MIKMTEKDFFKEHIPLVKTLRSGTKEEQLKEAKKQENEMKEYKDNEVNEKATAKEEKAEGEKPIKKKKMKMTDKLNELIGGTTEESKKMEKK